MPSLDYSVLFAKPLTEITFPKEAEKYTCLYNLQFNKPDIRLAEHASSIHGNKQIKNNGNTFTIKETIPKARKKNRKRKKKTDQNLMTPDKNEITIKNKRQTVSYSLILEDATLPLPERSVAKQHKWPSRIATTNRSSPSCTLSRKPKNTDNQHTKSFDRNYDLIGNLIQNDSLKRVNNDNFTEPKAVLLVSEQAKNSSLMDSKIKKSTNSTTRIYPVSTNKKTAAVVSEGYTINSPPVTSTICTQHSTPVSSTSCAQLSPPGVSAGYNTNHTPLDVTTVSSPPDVTDFYTKLSPPGVNDAYTKLSPPGVDDAYTKHSPPDVADAYTKLSPPGVADAYTKHSPPGVADAYTKHSPPDVAGDFTKHPPPGVNDAYTKHPPPDLNDLYNKHPSPDIAEADTKHPQPYVPDADTKHPPPDVAESDTKHPQPYVADADTKHPPPDVADADTKHPPPDDADTKLSSPYFSGDYREHSSPAVSVQGTASYSVITMPDNHPSVVSTKYTTNSDSVVTPNVTLESTITSSCVSHPVSHAATSGKSIKMFSSTVTKTITPVSADLSCNTPDGSTVPSFDNDRTTAASRIKRVSTDGNGENIYKLKGGPTESEELASTRKKDFPNDYCSFVSKGENIVTSSVSNTEIPNQELGNHVQPTKVFIPAAIKSCTTRTFKRPSRRTRLLDVPSNSNPTSDLVNPKPTGNSPEYTKSKVNFVSSELAESSTNWSSGCSPQEPITTNSLNYNVNISKLTGEESPIKSSEGETLRIETSDEKLDGKLKILKKLPKHFFSSDEDVDDKISEKAAVNPPNKSKSLSDSEVTEKDNSSFQDLGKSLDNDRKLQMLESLKSVENLMNKKSKQQQLQRELNQRNESFLEQRQIDRRHALKQNISKRRRSDVWITYDEKWEDSNDDDDDDADEGTATSEQHSYYSHNEDRRQYIPHEEGMGETLLVNSYQQSFKNNEHYNSYNNNYSYGVNNRIRSNSPKFPNDSPTFRSQSLQIPNDFPNFKSRSSQFPNDFTNFRSRSPQSPNDFLNFRSRLPQFSPGSFEHLSWSPQLPEHLPQFDGAGTKDITLHKPQMQYSNDDKKRRVEASNMEQHPVKKRKKRTLAERERRHQWNEKQKLQIQREKEKREYDKTRPCEFYRKHGKCNYGDKCTFSHDFVPEKRVQLCKYYIRNECLKQDCLFLHEEWPCKFYYVKKYCKNGDECRYSHAPPVGDIKDAFLALLQQEQALKNQQNEIQLPNKPTPYNMNPGLPDTPTSNSIGAINTPKHELYKSVNAVGTVTNIEESVISTVDDATTDSTTSSVTANPTSITVPEFTFPSLYRDLS